MSSQSEQHVIQQCAFFHSFVMEQMMVYWISTEPDPERLMNELVSGWKQRATAQYQQAARVRTQQTGLIDTEGEYFQSVLDEAERRIRLKLFSQVRRQRGELDDVIRGALEKCEIVAYAECEQGHLNALLGGEASESDEEATANLLKEMDRRIESRELDRNCGGCGAEANTWKLKVARREKADSAGRTM